MPLFNVEVITTRSRVLTDIKADNADQAKQHARDICSEENDDGEVFDVTLITEETY